MRSNYGFNYFSDNRWRFIGRDGSMGYRTGKVYRLGFIWHKPKANMDFSTGLTIFRTGWLKLDRGYCPYDNQDKFLENWELAR